jgi:serine/threonine-protein kinase
MNTEEPELGDNFGPYVLEGVLGEGATGVVFRAVRRKDRLPVALKILRRELAKDEVFTKRFVHEARAARELEHPHVVSVLDAGTVDGRLFLAMSYVEGGSLADSLAVSGPLPMRDVVRIAAEIGAALDALHARDLIHRDVKPANILLDARGTAALTDFGLAKGRAYTVLTRPGQVLGTVDYLAPEVIRGEGATEASDVYSLGCVVFTCLAGKPPFAAPSPIQVTVGHLGAAPPDPCAERDDAPPNLSAAVLWALEKEPVKRPVTAHAYALAIVRAGGIAMFVPER